jgi:gamma-glutamyltranspeptidase / glutathione hydrolase
MISRDMDAALAETAMVATSQPTATEAGLRALRRGGSAADAALAAAAVLCVTEPMSTGVGGDAFALVWHDGRLEALDAAGPAPALADPVAPVELRGPRSVTVPGAVAGWAALADRFGRLGLEACLEDAIDLAERGFEPQPQCLRAWREIESPIGDPGAPQPDLARTLRRIAAEGPRAFYEGEVARSIAGASWLSESDLASYRAGWVEPLTLSYRGVEVAELPPPTQGVAALEMLGLLEGLEPTRANQILCARLALEDAFERVRDGADVADLLEPWFLARRRLEAPGPLAEPPGGTVYLCAIDGDRMAVSFIQSLFMGFGSGIVAPGTGVVLQNRGACFALDGAVVPGRRPYHTIIPGMLLRDGGLWGPFGVMGGFIQAQAHMQLVSALVDDELDPQSALDRKRFRVHGAQVQEEGDEVDRRFGGGQAILVEGDGLVGGSDRRKDGYAGGF